MGKNYFFLFLVVFFTYPLFGQVNFEVNPSNGKVSYNLNEPITIEFSIADSDFIKLKSKELTITYGPEGANPKNYNTKRVVLNTNNQVIELDGQSFPQILRLKFAVSFEDKEISKEIGLAVGANKINTSVEKPVDFDSFWEKEISNLNNISLDTKMVHAPNISTELLDAYYIDYKVDQFGSRFYGVLTIPKGAKDKKYPAVVIYPGAGVRGYVGDGRFAKDNIITLQVGVHGIPVNLPPEVYTSMATGALSGYQYFNLRSKEKYFFNRVIKGCIRAIDFLGTLEKFDGKNIIANGSSQGGALSLIITSLDKRIKAAAVYCPALCQTNGSIKNTAAGWPKPMLEANLNADYSSNWENTIAYYDVVNFARNITVPVFMTFGMIDDVTPATTVFAAYNVIKSEKEHYLKMDVKHANHPTQLDAVKDYILRKIK